MQHTGGTKRRGRQITCRLLAGCVCGGYSRGGADHASGFPAALAMYVPCMYHVCGVRSTPRCAEEALLSIHVYDKGRRNLQGEHPLLT